MSKSDLKYFSKSI